MPTDLSALQALVESRKLLDQEPVKHTLLLETLDRLELALDADSMVYLLGPSRVGKGTAIHMLCEEMNAPVAEEPSQLRASMVRARTAHRGLYSWKRFYFEAMKAIGDPLPNRKVNRDVPASGVWRGTGSRYKSISEPELADRFMVGARQRGLEVLFIDEALALFKKQRESSMLDQLDVLRDLADSDHLKFVLVSTPRILEHLDLSEELESRAEAVYFPRYNRDDAAQFKTFRRVSVTLMTRLPKASRFRLEPQHQLKLHQGTAGCVGHLVRWFRSAIKCCVANGEHQLAWGHFVATFPSDDKVHRRWKRCLQGEELYRDVSERTFGDGCVWGARAEPKLADFDPEEAEPETPPANPSPRKPKASGRIGISGARRPAVGR